MFDKCKLYFIMECIHFISRSLQCNHLEEGSVKEWSTMSQICSVRRWLLQLCRGGPGKFSTLGDLDVMGRAGKTVSLPRRGWPGDFCSPAVVPPPPIPALFTCGCSSLVSPAATPLPQVGGMGDGMALV